MIGSRICAAASMAAEVICVDGWMFSYLVIECYGFLRNHYRRSKKACCRGDGDRAESDLYGLAFLSRRQ